MSFDGPATPRESPGSPVNHSCEFGLAGQRRSQSVLACPDRYRSAGVIAMNGPGEGTEPVSGRRCRKGTVQRFISRLSAFELSTTRIMAYVGDRMTRFTRHDASLHPPSVHDQGGTIMESHRSRRTRDQARKTWYAYYRQVRFARWFDIIGRDSSLDRVFLDLPSTSCPELTEPTPFSEPHLTTSC